MVKNSIRNIFFRINSSVLGGGSFPYTIGRIDHGHECRPDLCAYKNNNQPSSYIGRLYVDSLVHDCRALKYLVEIMDENCVMLGSDCPFPLGEDKPGELIMKTFDNDLDKCKKLLNSNARRFFKI
jgi:aminocarboxymuconate-semialdehyde decarboxylase